MSACSALTCRESTCQVYLMRKAEQLKHWLEQWKDVRVLSGVGETEKKIPDGDGRVFSFFRWNGTDPCFSGNHFREDFLSFCQNFMWCCYSVTIETRPECVIEGDGWREIGISQVQMFPLRYLNSSTVDSLKSNF